MATVYEKLSALEFCGVTVRAHIRNVQHDIDIEDVASDAKSELDEKDEKIRELESRIEQLEYALEEVT